MGTTIGTTIGTALYGSGFLSQLTGQLRRYALRIERRGPICARRAHAVAVIADTVTAMDLPTAATERATVVAAIHGALIPMVAAAVTSIDVTGDRTATVLRLDATTPAKAMAAAAAVGDLRADWLGGIIYGLAAAVDVDDVRPTIPALYPGLATGPASAAAVEAVFERYPDIADAWWSLFSLDELLCAAAAGNWPLAARWAFAILLRTGLSSPDPGDAAYHAVRAVYLAAGCSDGHARPRRYTPSVA